MNKQLKEIILNMIEEFYSKGYSDASINEYIDKIQTLINSRVCSNCFYMHEDAKGSGMQLKCINPDLPISTIHYTDIRLSDTVYSFGCILFKTNGKP